MILKITLRLRLQKISFSHGLQEGVGSGRTNGRLPSLACFRNRNAGERENAHSGLYGYTPLA